MKQAALKSFRYISYLEGISFLILLGIAIPLKYAADQPQMVTVTGMIHGVFFAAYIIGIFVMAALYRWKVLRIAGGILAAFLPFGPFVLERRIMRDTK
ncbi:conserved hypothetical protein [Paenibacillus curdlanolyticus YK9]|uniref:DUF3817 domain-containing protein n=1 Tax=Paenibacillus curdlanolyticus YK9 TaxID=717606 RepID=E0I5D2_9BACL|nr:DUF3817 domain-containing protein [Paenibacillus curdlanolyticus]EFM12174.1 conserved hypothetical protein [Paenibacillus curdlanolyticus YK9]